MQYQERKFFYIISSRNTTLTTLMKGDKIIYTMPTCPKYKFGITNNINNRIKWLKQEFHIEDIQVVYLKKYKNAKALEDYLKGFLYDKFDKQKEWFGEEESHEGTICTLNKIMENIEFFNNKLS